MICYKKGNCFGKITTIPLKKKQKETYDKLLRLVLTLVISLNFSNFE